MKKVTSFGTTVIDLLLQPFDMKPRQDRDHSLERIDMMIGGGSANTSIDLSRLGVDVSFTCAVGDDRMGDMVQTLLAREYFSPALVRVKQGLPTQMSVVCISSSGERTIVGRKNQPNLFTYEDIDFSLIDEADILFCGDFLNIPDFEGEPRARVLRYASEQGKLIIADATRAMDDVWLERIEPCLPYVDYFLPSFAEASPLCGGESDPYQIAAQLASYGVGNVVIKLGEAGCLLRTQNGAYAEIPAYPVKQVVDTTGAGDSFCAGFTAGIVYGYDLISCCKLGCAVGAHCIQAVGASTGVPCFADILAFIAERGDTLHLSEC